MQHQLEALDAILNQRDTFGVSCTETYAPVLRPREAPLFSSPQEMAGLVDELERRATAQLHCSYFGNPTALFRGPSSDAYQALLRNMGGQGELSRYYGDLTGEHVITRSCQEYELAVRAGLDHYTVHFGIDYSFSDGMYNYPEAYGLDRESVLEGALRQTVVYLSRFEEHLKKAGLLTGEHKLPTIGIENAGWGLEYGIQTASDYRRLFAFLEEVRCPLREVVTIDWDFNHLLHPLCRTPSGTASFMLPEEERTDEMRALEDTFGEEPAALAARWIETNVLAHDLLPRVRCIHISDSSWKSAPIFIRCQAVGEYLEELTQEQDPEIRAVIGEELVVTHYDNHLHLGHPRGMLTRDHVAPVLQALAREQTARGFGGATSPQLVILHELKGYPFVSTDGERAQETALTAQVKFIRECGVFFKDARVEVRI